MNISRAITFTAGLLLLIFFNACQYPVDSYELPNAQKFMVIDAQLTPKFGKVIVTYTITGVTALGGYNLQSPSNVTAYVLDSHGNRTNFVNTDGTPDTLFHGTIGETYQLFVTADGRTYQSDPETMRACPALDSVNAIYERREYLDPTDINYDGFDVYAQLTDVPGQKDYYQWDWIHYYRQASCGKAFQMGMYVLLPCLPIHCWGIAYNTKVVVGTDALRDGKAIAQNVVRVPLAIPPNKYYLRVEQRAITPTVYNYLKSVETQTQSVGTQFDVPAQTRFSPNVHNVSDPSEKILGVFSVFSYQRKIIYINMLQPLPGNPEVKIEDDPTPFTQDPFASAPCTEGLYRTQIRPDGWED
jgi:hypothetical protein